MSAVQCQSKEVSGNFNFDRVFDWSHTQEDVFRYSAESIVTDIMKGYNGTICAYGQSGSGKTHTMMGDMEKQDLKGLTPRIVESIFDTIQNSSADLEFIVKVCYMEIYQERIKDLLNPMNDNLPIHENKVQGVYVKGILEVSVASVEEVFDAMRIGQQSRVVASTGMNAESSRSHSIFVLQIQQKNSKTGSTKTGKLSLVDLAGSEKVGKTGATGQTLEEAKKINKSLSALGMVINALTDGKSSHIPYRDSKLTRILQESLGGNSRTTLIINCSPSSFNESETISTLRFGMRAKSIKNKAKINSEVSPAELKSMLRKAKQDVTMLQSEVDMISSELYEWRNGKSVPSTEWVSLPNHDIPAIASAAEKTSGSPDDIVSKDQAEEFLKRENELEDQLAQTERDLANQKSMVEELTKELAFYKDQHDELIAADLHLKSELNETKNKLEKIQFENNDNLIMIDSLNDSKALLQNQLDLLKVVQTN